MTTRRSSGGTGEAAYQRLAHREEVARGALSDRMEDGFDRLFHLLEDIRSDIRRGEQKADHLENRLSDFELQLNMTRDEVQKNQNVATPGRVASVKVAANELMNTRWGRVVKLAVGLAAVWGALKLTPEIVDGVKDTWMYVDSMNEPDTAKAATK